MSHLAVLSIVACLIISNAATADLSNELTTTVAVEERQPTESAPGEKTWKELSDGEKLAVRSEIAELIGSAMDKGVLLGEDSYGNEYDLIYDHLTNRAVVAMVTEDGEIHPLSSPIKVEKQEVASETDEADDSNEEQPQEKQPVQFNWNVGRCNNQRLRQKRQASWRFGSGRQGVGLYGRYRNGQAYITGRTNFRNNFNVRAGASYRTRFGTFRVGGTYGGSFNSGRYRSNYGVRLGYSFRF